MIRRRVRARLVVLLAAVAVAGCGGTPAAGGPSGSLAAPALPQRPAALTLDGVDACALLSDAQRGQLQVNRGRPAENIEDPDRPACDWSNFPNVPDNGWEARIIMRYGAEHYLGSTAGTQQVSVNGFPTVQTSSPERRSDRYCLLFVDVAPGQTLEVYYENMRGDYPGISHEVACQQATKAATLMMDTLKSQKG